PSPFEMDQRRDSCPFLCPYLLLVQASSCFRRLRSLMPRRQDSRLSLRRLEAAPPVCFCFYLFLYLYLFLPQASPPLRSSTSSLLRRQDSRSRSRLRRLAFARPVCFCPYLFLFLFLFRKVSPRPPKLPKFRARPKRSHQQTQRRCRQCLAAGYSWNPAF